MGFLTQLLPRWLRQKEEREEAAREVKASFGETTWSHAGPKRQPRADAKAARKRLRKMARESRKANRGLHARSGRREA